MEHKGLYYMPPEVLDMIVKYLPVEDKKQVREVCMKFRDVVDMQARYKVHLNNRTCAAFRKFNPGTKIKTLVVEDLDLKMKSRSSTRSILANKEVEELVIAGRSLYKETRAETSQKRFQYPYLANETVIRREFDHWITKENLTVGISEVNLKHIFCFTNKTVTKLVISSDIFVDHSNLSKLCGSTILFPNLESLEVIIVHHVISEVRLRVNTSLEKIFDLRFPRLQRIALSAPCLCNNLLIGQWIKFYKCVVAHHATLRELELRHHFHFDTTSFMTGNSVESMEIRGILDNLTNVQLKRLSLAILDNMPQYWSQRLVFADSFEIQLLKSQTQLEVLKLDIGSHLFADGIFEHLPKIAKLKACSIHVFKTNGTPSIVNLNFLQKSKGLKCLQVVCQQDLTDIDGSPWTLTGIESLSPTIEQLSLSTGLRIGEATWIENNLVNVKELRYVGGVRRARNSKILPACCVRFFNYFHFFMCARNMKNLKIFRYMFHNDLIQPYRNENLLGIKIEIDPPFTEVGIPYDMQH